MQLKSPAKINLFLRILGRRQDGYHELASLFQAIDLVDILHFQESDEDIFTCSEPSLTVNHDNLVVKSRNLFRSKTGISRCFTIHLDKKIPVQAGLGGGSSNAATTLWGLNELCGRPASEAQLCQWSSEIGSDIPFFLSLGTAYCTGRGEILRQCAPLPKQNISIVKPRKGLSTPQVFGMLNTHQLQPRDPEKALQSFYQGSPIYFNDLEIPAFELMPELSILKKKLEDSGFATVMMSGTGSSLCCLGEGKPHLQDHQSYKASFINREAGSWF